jgi:vitamin B12 transporter
MIWGLRRFTAIAFVSLSWTVVTSFALAADEAPPDSVPAGASADVPGAPRYHLPPTVVTAERRPLSLDRVPSELTVIRRERIDRMQAPFLADELREVASVDVQRSGSFGKLTDVRLRGADPRHTLVLFDGIPLNGPWAGTFDFADLSGAGWGQVEVMGGPSSSLYGSGAVGGVIQFLSPSTPGRDARNDPYARSLRAGVEVGELSTTRQTLEWNGGSGDASYGGFGSRLTSDGQGPRDAYEGLAARAHALVPVGGDKLRVSGLFTHGEKEVPYDYRFDTTDFTTHQVFDPNTDETDKIAAGRASFTHAFSSHAGLEAEVSAFQGRIDYQNRADTTGGDFTDTKLDNARGIGALRARLSSGNVGALLGAEYRAEGVDRDDDSQFGGFPSVTNVDQDVHTRSLYAQAHGEWTRLLLDLGIRLDDHSRYGSIGVPRIAAAVPIQEAGLKIRAGYGRAFTAPTLTDLYYPFYGSETLRPERSTTWEAGVDGRWLDGKLEAHLTGHTTTFHDLIQSNSFFQADNIGNARVEGVEVSTRALVRRGFSLEARAARLWAKDLDSGDPLPKRPRWRAGVSADVSPASWATATASLRWVDSMIDPFNFVAPDGRMLDGDNPGYASLDLGVMAALARWIPAEARVRVVNALDREYSEVKGYPALGRTFIVGLSYTH